MKAFATILAAAAGWFAALMFIGFASRATYEVLHFGWSLWP
jgi:hypothetical protein